MNAQLITGLVVVATILGVGMTIPQVVRVQRRRDFEGVSLVWVGVGIAINSWWMIYGAAMELWGLIPVSAGSVVLYITLAVQALVFTGRGASRTLLKGLVPLLCLPVFALAAFGWESVGLLVGLAYSVQFSPAVVACYRTRTPTGVSATTWTMAGIEGGIWAVYGIHYADLGLGLGGFGAATLAALILARITWLSGNNSRMSLGQA